MHLRVCRLLCRNKRAYMFDTNSIKCQIGKRFWERGEGEWRGRKFKLEINVIYVCTCIYAFLTKICAAHRTGEQSPRSAYHQSGARVPMLQLDALLRNFTASGLLLSITASELPHSRLGSPTACSLPGIPPFPFGTTSRKIINRFHRLGARSTRAREPLSAGNRSRPV